ncbi:hypothetical protein Taro_013052 [Colocasia esculenta]|uniref:RING-type E3 ubiquitin transferase n=1 Tax=Colocasia esculenta TaxID=4460 RepID=A0A843UFD7_COLES|nr:hypothetical protein [Colocasia esculenta]
MLCTHQASCTKMERGRSHLHTNPCNVLGNAADFLNPSSDPVISASGSPASFHLSQFTGYHDNCVSHSHQHHRQQPPATSNHLDSVGSSNFENPYVHSSSVSNYLSTPEIGSDQQSFSRTSTRGASRNHHGTGDPRGAHKDKNAVQVPGDYVHDMSPLNSGMQSGDELCEVRFNMMGANFNAPEYRHGFLPLAEGCQPDVTRLQMESPFWHHHNHNHLFQMNYFGPSFQPGFTWVEQLRSNPGVGSMWNNPTMPYFEGSLDFGNMGCHQGFSFGRNPAIFHSPSAHSLPHLQPVQGMQVPNYSHHPRIPVLNNLLHHHMINTSREGLDSVASGPRPFPSNVDEWSYRPYRRLPQAVADPSGNRMRILSAQELLALEEQIGNVKTGLPEEAILKNLKMSTFSTPASLVNSSPDNAAETGTCIICQVWTRVTGQNEAPNWMMVATLVYSSSE